MRKQLYNARKRVAENIAIAMPDRVAFGCRTNAVKLAGRRLGARMPPIWGRERRRLAAPRAASVALPTSEKFLVRGGVMLVAERP